jgi:hypothetical protein
MRSDGGIDAGVKDPAVMFVAAILLTVHSSFGESTSDNCRTSPGASARPGLHWYYRTDRTNNRHCWFLNTEGMDVHSHGNVPSHPMPKHENVVEQTTRSQSDAIVLQVPINPSDNNVVTIATGNSFQQVVGSNSSATERQALIIKNNALKNTFPASDPVSIVQPAPRPPTSTA